MLYKVEHISNKYKITNKKMNVKYITIHSTSNLNSTAKNERDNLNRKKNTSSTGFHIVVDDKEAIECIPLDMVAWHAGDGRNGTGNISSVGVEMCESGNRHKVIFNTIEIVVKLLNKYNLKVHNVKRHYDWSGKNCPRILNNNWKLWKEFLKCVEYRKANSILNYSFKSNLDLDNDLFNNYKNCLNNHWAEKDYFSLINKGLEINEKRFDDFITRGEVFSLINRLLELQFRE